MYLIRKIQVDDMVETKCIFQGKKSRCRSDPRRDLPLLMCQQHLKQYYGLEVGNELIDGVKQVAYAGALLRPILDFSIFSRNEVIFPTKYFMDLNIRPKDMSNIDTYNLLGKYTLNKTIERTIQEYANTFPDSIEHRHVVEMYRNFMEGDDVDTDPNHKDHLPKLQALVEAKKKLSEVFIRNQPVSQTLKDNFIFIGGKAYNITERKWSKNFQYLLNNCMYAEWQIGPNMYLDHIPANVAFIEKVGLVATEMIVYPVYLVIDGLSIASSIYYNAHVGLIDKIIQQSKYNLSDIPRQYILDEAWKGGTLC